MKVGVLALQGCVDPHLVLLRHLGAEALPVRTTEELHGVDRLVLPGGESTTMLHLLHRTALFAPLQSFCQRRPVWGVCAGAILLAERVENPAQPSLGAMRICARRNHYGSQRESFQATVSVTGLSAPLTVDFIRAPLLTPLDSTVETLASFEGSPVCLRDGARIASSFHTELGVDPSLHRYFLEM